MKNFISKLLEFKKFQDYFEKSKYLIFQKISIKCQFIFIVFEKILKPEKMAVRLNFTVPKRKLRINEHCSQTEIFLHFMKV